MLEAYGSMIRACSCIPACAVNVALGPLKTWKSEMAILHLHDSSTLSCLMAALTQKGALDRFAWPKGTGLRVADTKIQKIEYLFGTPWLGCSECCCPLRVAIWMQFAQVHCGNWKCLVKTKDTKGKGFHKAVIQDYGNGLWDIMGASFLDPINQKTNQKTAMHSKPSYIHADTYKHIQTQPHACSLKSPKHLDFWAPEARNDEFHSERQGI